MLQLLVVDPTRRLSAAQVQRHPWVAMVRHSTKAPSLDARSVLRCGSPFVLVCELFVAGVGAGLLWLLVPGLCGRHRGVPVRRPVQVEGVHRPQEAQSMGMHFVRARRQSVAYLSWGMHVLVWLVCAGVVVLVARDALR